MLAMREQLVLLRLLLVSPAGGRGCAATLGPVWRLLLLLLLLPVGNSTRGVGRHNAHH